MEETLKPTGRTRIFRCVLFFAVALPLFSFPGAHAVGILKVESNGFLRTATDRPNSTQTLSVGPKGKAEGEIFTAEADVQAVVQVSDKSTFTPEATNLYVGTSVNLSETHQVSIGRKTDDWSMADDALELGMYSPRFIWDPTRPQKVGMSGLFYQLRSENFVGTAFATGMDIPERGFPVREENGRMSSSNPFYVPLPDYAEYPATGALIPIRYHVNYPPMTDLILNPGAALKLRWQNSAKRGAWVQVSGGYLPIHQPDLSIEDTQIYNPTDNVVDIQVHPSIQYHRLLTLETGVKARRFSVWGSLTDEQPDERERLPGRLYPQLEHSIIAAIGGDAILARGWKLNASFLHIHEDPGPELEEEPIVNVDLPSRFTYKRAIRSGLEIEGTERMSYGARWIYDLAGESHLASLDTYINLLKRSRNLTLNLGTDFFISSTGKGTLGQYKGNDRIRGSIAYVF